MKIYNAYLCPVCGSEITGFKGSVSTELVPCFQLVCENGHVHDKNDLAKVPIIKESDYATDSSIAQESQECS